jgi:hypothetical protein
MIGEAIKLALENVPAIMFVAAIAVAFARRQADLPSALLNWLLLLAVGVDALWAGVFHTLFPQIAAGSIGWRPNPFQYEVGVADIAMGAIAVTAFWRPLPFKAAVVGYVTLFYLGVTIGHVREAVVAGNFSPNNFGLLLVLTVAKMILLPALYLKVRNRERLVGAA